MKPRCFIALYVLVASHAMGDGASVLARGTAGPWVVTLFAPEKPLHAGTVDLSILVLNGRTREPSADVEVAMETPSERITFRHRARGNRILYSATPVLKASTNMPAEISIRGDGKEAVLPCSLQVEPADNSVVGYVLCFAAVPVGFLVAWRVASRFKPTGG